MTAVFVDHYELLAGANDPHGEHEDPRQGWDTWARARHQPDPDADTYGRHAAREAVQVVPS